MRQKCDLLGPPPVVPPPSFQALSAQSCKHTQEIHRRGGDGRDLILVAKAHGHTGNGTRRRTPPAIAGGALKTALSWSAVIPALAADICTSFCTVSVSFAAGA